MSEIWNIFYKFYLIFIVLTILSVNLQNTLSSLVTVLNEQLDNYCDNTHTRSNSSLTECNQRVWHLQNKMKYEKINGFDDSSKYTFDKHEQILSQCAAMSDCVAMSFTYENYKQCEIFKKNFTKKNDDKWSTYELKCCDLKPIDKVNSANKNLLMMHNPNEHCTTDSLAIQYGPNCNGKIWKIHESKKHDQKLTPSEAKSTGESDVESCLRKCLADSKCLLVSIHMKNGVSCFHIQISQNLTTLETNTEWAVYEPLCCELKTVTTGITTSTPKGNRIGHSPPELPSQRRDKKEVAPEEDHLSNKKKTVRWYLIAPIVPLFFIFGGCLIVLSFSKVMKDANQEKDIESISEDTSSY